MPCNRTLPQWLLRRLDEVAAHHGGRVPLHGRLFAQWMHYAYPRECRYPHVSGATDPSKTRLSADNLNTAAATEEEMRQYINAVPARELGEANLTEDAEAQARCA